MKRSLLLVAALLLAGTQAEAQSYWIQKAGSAAADEAMDISSDAQNNTYTTGYYSASGQFGTFTLTNSGITDIFLTKTNSAGVFQWAVKGGGPGSDRGLSVKTDASGNSVVTGYYYNTAAFGTQNITSNGLQDIFIAKYDNAGNLMWVQTAGGPLADIGNAVNLSPNGDVVITGEFTGTAQFGTFLLTSQNASVDVFTARLDANGNFLWAKQGAAPQTDRGLDLACDAQGNVYVTGQFTDTITFDQPHNNNMFNAVFLIKYNSAGTEQWFRVIGGASQQIANAIAVDNSNNILLAGDFLGLLTFFNCPTNISLTHIYPNRIFVASYNTSGDLNWNEADGSNDLVSARNLACDGSGNVYVTGNFKCVFNEYADQYGQGTFNTVGFRDAFISNYSSSGVRQWSRQIGGKNEDSGHGIALIQQTRPVICGSFNNHLGIPTTPGFTGYGYNSSTNVSHGTYCGDNAYGSFGYYLGGGIEAFIGSIADLTREPYDYYTRTGNGCTRDYVGVCIVTGNTTPDNQCSTDTVTYCGGVLLTAASNTALLSPNALTSIGPDFTYLWSTGATTRTIYASSAGSYAVTITSADGCFTSQDTIHVIIQPNPPLPLISDDEVVNTNASSPQPIQFCAPGTVWLWASNFNSQDSIFWFDPNTGTYIYNDSMLVSESGIYCFTVTNPYGCSAMNCVNVIKDSLLPPIDPAMNCIQDPDVNDSISICQGAWFTMHVYDSISNPNGILACIPYATVYWSVTPSTITYFSPTVCSPFLTNAFSPQQTGWYNISAMVVRKNYCDTDTVYVNRNIYVTLNPVPLITISGNTVICPGDSTWLVASGGGSYQWSNPSSNNDSVLVVQGFYMCTVTNSFGCTASASIVVTLKPPPVVTMNPASGLLCPNDSVQLMCSGSGIFQWYGPSGPVGGNTSAIYVNTPGNYYCVLVDTGGCTLVSNTVSVIQYATPLLQGSPDNVICPDDSVVINVVTNPGSTVQWLSPLSGSALSQTVTSPGTYSCSVTSCGITTVISITITLSVPTAQITALDTLTFCEGDSTALSANSGNYTYFWSPYGYNTQTIFAFESGTYILTVTDVYGCTDSDSIVVGTYPNPFTSPPVVTDAFICEGRQAVLNVQGMPVVEWFTSPVGQAFHYGNTYTTPPLYSNVIYYVQSASGGCRSEMAQVAITVDECPVTIPNVFTPNGDGVNDIFTFNAEGMQSLRCRIYNRWGNLIYAVNDILTGWDGTNMHNGEPVSDGVYYYIADIEDLGGNIRKEHGYIQVLQH